MELTGRMLGKVNLISKEKNPKESEIISIKCLIEILFNIIFLI